ncbi:DUF2642 domain-containing protein [Sporosarcina jiandibaonis]|uniref:DUF2642 domain-containing protein n=1 Tax=Sporosarcina jiandibaonis TaxID=2715535 RepID=UPI001551C65B|nr:DUF2642 domain-containing protein [Sporosarcina jiandibaonis]
MNKIIQSLVKEVVQIEISGKKLINGTLIDLGSDVLVLFNGTDFLYIPTNHIQCLTTNLTDDFEIKVPTEFPSILMEDDDQEDLSIIKVLTQAQDEFVVIYVTGSQPLHGIITSIKNNYFVFHSPVYKTMYIALNHLKWLIPYSENKKPYGLDGNNFLVQSNNELLASAFEAQVENLKNKLVVFNIGEKKKHIGKINNVEDQIVEIQTARTYPIYLNLSHIKTIHPV